MFFLDFLLITTGWNLMLFSSRICMHKANTNYNNKFVELCIKALSCITSYHNHARRGYGGGERHREVTTATWPHGEWWWGKELSAQMGFECSLLISLSTLSLPAFSITTPIRKIIKSLLHFLIIRGVEVRKGEQFGDMKLLNAYVLCPVMPYEYYYK